MISNIGTDIKVNFKGSSHVEELGHTPKGNAMSTVNHKTALFRDLEILKFTTDYLKQSFPNGGAIVHQACSTGDELYSTKMLTDANGGNFSFLGFDIGPEAIQRAVKGLYLNQQDTNWLNKQPHKEANKINTMLNISFDKNKNNPNHLIPRDSFKKGIEFSIGNISDISNQNLPKDTAAIFFKNAFYHINGNHWSNSALSQENLQNSEKLKSFLISGFQKTTEIIQGVHNHLNSKGLFIVGHSEPDHFFNIAKFSKNGPNGAIDLFNNKDIKDIVTSFLEETKLPKPLIANDRQEGILDLVLRKTGFEPLKWSDMNKNIASKVSNYSLKLASVWKKV